MSPTSQSSGAFRLFRAPGRVNLIGEHTDYNDGFVMPVAINLSTWIELQTLDQRRLEVFSENSAEGFEFLLDEKSPKARGHWSDYIVGVALMLEQSGVQLRGARMRIKGEVPIGSGLSSSAALEVATALALTANSNVEMDRIDVARLCQRAENEFVGARVGIMDQFVSLNGCRDKALLLDCRSLEFRHLPIADTALLVVCNTMVKHELAASEYNERRRECEAGVSYLASRLEKVKALRDVTIDQLMHHRAEMPEPVFRRCRHVVTENTRVLEAAVSLEQGDLDHFGELMYESHRSLRDDYEVSCAELDLMVDLARRLSGVFGARMTGGGFGGCTVNLVGLEQVYAFKERITADYENATGLRPEIYICNAADGAEELTTQVEG